MNVQVPVDIRDPTVFQGPMGIQGPVDMRGPVDLSDIGAYSGVSEPPNTDCSARWPVDF
ncbi:hypothetical protein [Ancylothrix sp. D3o]|uniref:hypothetical protein n=1 Tax=Ancylothrix sp. D3o TaxID=2953691 RepID=UPI0021BB7183|nr:hypothetical protein [Ancylothrix sp. D3o]